jgi:hypothetical protein
MSLKMDILSYCNIAHAESGLYDKTMMGLARKLKAAGYPDTEVHGIRNGRVDVIYKSLYWMADHTIREEPVLRVHKYAKFKPLTEEEEAA